MAQKRKPDRVDVVIIGAGASGATDGVLAVHGRSQASMILLRIA